MLGDELISLKLVPETESGVQVSSFDSGNLSIKNKKSSESKKSRSELTTGKQSSLSPKKRNSKHLGANFSNVAAAVTSTNGL